MDHSSVSFMRVVVVTVAMAVGVRSMIVHDVFVTWDASEDKAEQFIPRRREEFGFWFPRPRGERQFKKERQLRAMLFRRARGELEQAGTFSLFACSSSGRADRTSARG